MTDDVQFAPSGWTAYVADEPYLQDLVQELGGDVEVRGRLVLAKGDPRPAAWALNIWQQPQRMAFGSINQAARGLRSLQRNWCLLPLEHFRRSALIQDKLPHVSAKPLRFGDAAPAAPLGSWTLLDQNTALVAPRCSSPFPNGAPSFIEDRARPPNRAYLKLWEALTRLPSRPQPGERCIDLGASPGGWSWVLHELGAEVVSVDKAPLAAAIASLPRIEVHTKSAWSLEPQELGAVDWLFCDIACYPDRLLRLVREWLAAGTCRNFVCTIKFQGETDHAIAAEFAAIPGSRLMHLAHNKHELTWALLRSNAVGD